MTLSWGTFAASPSADLLGAVGGRVVDDDDLEVLGQPGQHIQGARHGAFDVVLLVPGGEEEADAWIVGHGRDLGVFKRCKTQPVGSRGRRSNAIVGVAPERKPMVPSGPTLDGETVGDKPLAVLVVDDSRATAAKLGRALGAERYASRVVPAGPEVPRLALDADVVVLCLTQDEDLTLLRRLLEGGGAGRATPILVSVPPEARGAARGRPAPGRRGGDRALGRGRAARAPGALHLAPGRCSTRSPRRSSSCSSSPCWMG